MWMIVTLITVNGIKWNAKKQFRVGLFSAEPLIHSVKDFPNYKMAEKRSVTTMSHQILFEPMARRSPQMPLLCVGLMQLLPRSWKRISSFWRWVVWEIFNGDHVSISINIHNFTVWREILLNPIDFESWQRLKSQPNISVCIHFNCWELCIYLMTKNWKNLFRFMKFHWNCWWFVMVVLVEFFLWSCRIAAFFCLAAPKLLFNNCMRLSRSNSVSKGVLVIDNGPKNFWTSEQDLLIRKHQYWFEL